MFAIVFIPGPALIDHNSNPSVLDAPAAVSSGDYYSAVLAPPASFRDAARWTALGAKKDLGVWSTFDTLLCSFVVLHHRLERNRVSGVGVLINVISFRQGIHQSISTLN